MSERYMLICPQCGKIYGSNNRSCPFCKSDMIDTDTTWDQWGDMSIQEDTSLLVWETKQLEKIKQSDQFSQALYDARIKWEKEQEEIGEARGAAALAEFEREHGLSKPVLHCPTCGSTNVNKISLGKKVVGIFGFGLLSKNARSQFECDDCGYKW